jgi:hypothetical protein
MKFNPAFLRAARSVIAITNAPLLPLRADHAPRALLPDAVVDLRISEGVGLVSAQWRYNDTTIQGIRVDR